MKNVCTWQTRVRAYVPMRNKFVHHPRLTVHRLPTAGPTAKRNQIWRHYRNTIRDSVGTRGRQFALKSARARISLRPITVVRVASLVLREIISVAIKINIHIRISMPPYIYCFLCSSCVRNKNRYWIKKPSRYSNKRALFFSTATNVRELLLRKK